MFTLSVAERDRSGSCSAESSPTIARHRPRCCGPARLFFTQPLYAAFELSSDSKNFALHLTLRHVVFEMPVRHLKQVVVTGGFEPEPIVE
jgi:hypothetical protein